jgi:hypothetical protein
MKAKRQYLLGSVGSYAVLIPSEGISGVWVSGDAPRVDWTDALAIDLRSLFSLTGGRQSAQVALRSEGSFARVVVLDAIAELHMLADREFSPLPSAFGYALGMFDGLCTTPLGGMYALRMRREPNFTPMLSGGIVAPLTSDCMASIETSLP